MNLTLLLQRAQDAQRRGDTKAAKQQYEELLKHDFQTEHVLGALLPLVLHTNDYERAVAICEQLCTINPGSLAYCEAAAKLNATLQRWQQAADCYKQFLQTNPNHADAVYNYAYHLKHTGQYQQAIDNYQRALELHIDQPEEVLTNIAVIYSENLRREAKAKEALQRALIISPRYVPALFNLATLFEESGNRLDAAEHYRRILEIEPDSTMALVRLADCESVPDRQAPIIGSLQSALQRENLDQAAKISLQYALGKALDDCGEYEQAFDSYTLANQLESRQRPRYSHAAQEQAVLQNSEFFSQQWFDQLSPVSDASPVFICGMFRSGSTLLEQMLASHSSVTAGGERDYFARLTRTSLAPYPAALSTLDHEHLRGLAADYLTNLRRAFPDSGLVIDKRPDNVLYLGLIMTLFPRAKIILTARHPIDNCLSIFFLRTSAALTYATNLNDIAHYYEQHERLISHWKNVFADSIHTVSYDQLVADPEPSLRRVLEFLDLDWEPGCLNFHRLNNHVKTASVWQVRQPLYQASSGRWKNYANLIDALDDRFKTMLD